MPAVNAESTVEDRAVIPLIITVCSNGGADVEAVSVAVTRTAAVDRHPGPICTQSLPDICAYSRIRAMECKFAIHEASCIRVSEPSATTRECQNQSPADDAAGRCWSTHATKGVVLL